MVNVAMICLIGLTILYRIETWVAYGGTYHAPAYICFGRLFDRIPLQTFGS